MTWAYSPSYGKPLSVPQGVIGLMTRFGMDVVLAHPEGYEVFEDVEKVAKENRGKIPADLSQRQTIWQKHSKMPISYIRRAGLRSLQWKTYGTVRKRRLRRHCSSGERTARSECRTQRLGLIQKSSWLQQRRKSTLYALSAG